MVKKSLKKSLNIVCLGMMFSLCFAFLGEKETPEDVDAFHVTNNVSDTEDYIEAYQTTNSCEIEAYVTDVHFVDER